jgi:ATP-dependent Clp protease ATP-binding subunit ClpC
VDGSPRSARARGAGRRTARGLRCSCELVVDLAGREPAASILSALGVRPAELSAAIGPMHEHLAPEPADWHLRLAQRGATASDLERLLAVVRSADSHGYQLLERTGVRCASVRKEILDRIRKSPLAEGRPSRSDGPDPASVRPRRASQAAILQHDPEAPDPSEAGPRPAVRQARSPVTEAPAQPTMRARPAASPEPARPHAEPLDDDPAPARRSAPAALDPATLPELCGREEDLRRLADAVQRSSSRPTLLVGPPGSGRTLLAQHLAAILPVSVHALDATAYADDEDLRADLAAIAKRRGIAILDDLDRLPLDLAPSFVAALAHAWASGSPPVLLVVSAEARARLEGWLAAGTDGVDAVEPTALRGAELEAAVAASAPAVLAAHGLSLHADARMGELVRITERYLGGLAMPGRALDVLDLSCARTKREGGRAVRRDTWIEIVAERSGLSRARIESPGDPSLLELEEALAARVVGHKDALSTLASLVRRNRAGFSGTRPIASVLLLGPSGVGKTEIAKALAETLYDRPDALVRLDMSEYAESHAVARIVGAPPGYVGHEQGGALTDPLRRRPHCVVLLDEIEKAHRDVHQLLLQVFDDGRLTDGRGRTVDFRHALVVMTSNLGADLVRHGPLDHDGVLRAARSAFPVELWNRIEAPLVLEPLDEDAKIRICRRLVRGSSERLLRERGIRYGLTEAALRHLVALGGRDPMLGARPLRHLLSREVEALVADAVLRGRLRAGARAEVDVHAGRFRLGSAPDPQPNPQMAP